MKRRLHVHWKKVPSQVRRPIVLFVGCTLILTAGAIGWLPGPGGIPVFLLGIAVLASEFSWANRLKNAMLGIIHRIGKWIKANPILGSIILLMSVTTSLMITAMLLLRK